jgi:hypothetical protein
MVDCMLQRVRISLPLALLAATAACGPSDNDPGPGGVTVGEARALDEAAEMIEQQRLPDDALPPPSGEEAPKPPQEQNKPEE